MNKLTIGDIKFINCLPLHYGMEQGGYGQQLLRRGGTPAELNQLVSSGELAISPVSSIIYAQHSDKLLIMPDVSISARGGLESILLVSKYPIRELKEARIALTAKSATSHGLLKIILSHAYQAQPEYFVSRLTLHDGAIDEADAVLFIGDEALQAYHNRQAGFYYYDLGDEWQKMTGLQMVYAVWVVNRQFAAAHASLVRQAHQTVTKAFSYGLENLPAAAAWIAPQVPFTQEQIVHYIRLLNYRFTPAHQEALLTYYRLAHVLGLINGVPELEFAEVLA